jgi:hypothetical protein
MYVCMYVTLSLSLSLSLSHTHTHTHTHTHILTDVLGVPSPGLRVDGLPDATKDAERV